MLWVFCVLAVAAIILWEWAPWILVVVVTFLFLRERGKRLAAQRAWQQYDLLHGRWAQWRRENLPDYCEPPKLREHNILLGSCIDAWDQVIATEEWQRPSYLRHRAWLEDQLISDGEYTSGTP